MRIWFQDRSTTPLEIVRIGLGARCCSTMRFATPHVLTFWGDDGWMPRSAHRRRDTTDPWMQSVMFYFTAPWQWHAFHALFLFCCAALMVGWQTRFVKWLVLIGHISYDYRNPSLVYGVDAIAACLLLILCFAPIGRALELGPGARGPSRQAQGPQPAREPAALHQPLGVRLHPPDANSDGGAVLLQRRRQAQGRRLVGRQRGLAGVRQQRLLQRRSCSTCSPRTSGWSMSRPTAQS